ncbi:hypothetical protein SDJN03_19113, partial [Cucurbita argyrosperma subsp. sororia]
MMRTDSGRGSSSRQPEGAEIVYSKENVTIQPTQFASERIRGRLRLIKRESSLFITWIPYEGQNSNAKLSRIRIRKGYASMGGMQKLYCACAGENAAANIPPGTPSSLPLDDGTYYVQQDEVL